MSKVAGALLLAAWISGCAVNRATATVDPGTDLARIKTAYVVKLPKDERGVNDLIVDKLKARGVAATTGAQAQAPGPVDAIVTYADKWMWDITMYMLELTVALREPQTDYPLATANSFHTSLTRKSPKEMVDEVIENIFKGRN